MLFWVEEGLVPDRGWCFTDERYWVRPNDFIPERWTTKTELTKNGSVYAPFGFGKSHSPPFTSMTPPPPSHKVFPTLDRDKTSTTH